jgi:uncharacterized protein (TIGR03086 family)
MLSSLAYDRSLSLDAGSSVVGLTDLLRMDAAALALISHDVALIPDSALAAPTPCTGWTITDLLRHMNERHAAVARMLLPPLPAVEADPRGDFARIVACWTVVVEQAGEILDLPRQGPQPTRRVLGIHVVDMLTHRWDLARALDRPLALPAGLAEAALPLARANTAPGSPLNGPGGAYRPSLPEEPTDSAMDRIVALLGRSPRWTRPAPG